MESEHGHAGAAAAEKVLAYYESNTRHFLRLGIGWRTLAIRRAVWAEGVSSLEEAVNYVNTLIAAQVDTAAATLARAPSAAKDQELLVLDIGCGVGGSLFFLAGAGRAAIRGVGVTISPRQALIANGQARLRGLAHRLSFLAEDFTRVPGLPTVSIAFAIESFVHFSSPAAFFSPAARALVPGGRLVVVDDFLSGNRLSRKDHRSIEAFRRGWVLSSLCTVARAVQSAQACGLRLVEDEDLSAFLSPLRLGARTGRWAVRILSAIPAPWPYWRSTVGSLALAACHRAGLVAYHFLVFEKSRV